MNIYLFILKGIFSNIKLNINFIIDTCFFLSQKNITYIKNDS